MRRSTIIPTLVTLTLAAAACSTDSERRTVPFDTTDAPVDAADVEGERRDDPARSARVALRQFDGCDAFLDHVRTEGGDRVGAYGFENEGWYGPLDDVAMTETTEAMSEDAAADSESSTDDSFAAAETGARSEQAAGGSDGVSGTNVQVEGVDEPDIVKTDGERILAVTNGELHLVDVDGAARRDSIPLLDRIGPDSYVFGQEILFSGDRAFVIAQVEGGGEVRPFDTPVVDAPPITEPEGGGDAEAEFVDDSELFEPGPDQLFPGGSASGPTTVVVEVDLSDPDDLAVVNTLTLEGRYISARSIGDTARIAITSPPQDLGFLYPSGRNAEDAAIEANRRLVRESTIDDWVPRYALSGSAGEATGDLASCERIHAPDEFAGFDMLSVLTLPLDESLAAPTATTSVMATGDTVYASQDRLYVSTNEWMPPSLDEQQRGVWEETYTTQIHRFSLPDGAPAEYEASGSVDGHLLNQFSMHDDGETFFVATTTGTPWSSDLSESQIVSMRPDGDRLEAIGRVGGLGKGEQIFSVRYVDDVAYVVTFRQTDPFYVVDLSSPTDMRVTGELKIPGVSNYLHPISDTLVLGVGQDATEDGFQTGSKVSLFDVSDPSAPRELDVWTLPNASSDVEFDHRAFLWWEPTSTAVLPLISYQEQFAGAVVLNVTAEGVTEQGRITHNDDITEPVGVTDCEVFDPSGLTEDSGELFWMAQDAQINLCAPGQQGGATGLYCDRIPVDDIGNWFGVEGSELGIDLDGIDRIEICWPEGGFPGSDNVILRTMVIGDQLWTVSNGRVQANALTTLDTTDRVELR